LQQGGSTAVFILNYRLKSHFKGYFFRFFLSGRWVSADPATDFDFFELFLSLSISEAIFPTRFDVFSFLAILFPFQRYWLFCQTL